MNVIFKSLQKFFFVSNNDYEFLTNNKKPNVHIIPNGVEFPKNLFI